jgi:hypothetical protein
VTDNGRREAATRASASEHVPHAPAPPSGELADIGKREVSAPETPGEAKAAASTALSASGSPPITKQASPAPPSASGELAAIGEREVATPEAPKDPGPRPPPPVLETSAKASPAPAPVFGNPGDSGEHKPATPEPRGEAEPTGPTAVLVSGLPPAGKKMASAPPSASGDLAAIGEREVAAPEAPKDPGPHHSQHNTHTASLGNIPASTGNSTAQLNQQELARQRSVAGTSNNGILGFFRSLFH